MTPDVKAGLIQPAETTRARGRGMTGPKVMQDLSLWEQFQRVGGALTPVQVSSIIREADAGDTRRLMDLANDARQKDCHLSAVLSQSEESIAGLEWSLHLPKKAKKKDRHASEWVENWLRTKVHEPFTSLIAHLAGGVYYSFAVSETVWSKDPKGYLVPVDFENQNQRRFAFRQSDGRLVWRDQSMSTDGVDFRADYPNRFVTAQPRVTGDVPCREGLARVLVWATLFRTWDLTDWLRTGEAAWKPWRVGYYEKGSQDEDIDGLVEVLERLATTGTAALPVNTKLQIEWPGGAGGTRTTHSELYNVLAQEMSKAALGQTETVQASNSSGYAQAKVHQAVRGNILRARARYIAAVITRDVIRAMIELNFGTGILVPTFKFETADPVDLKSFSEGLKNLTAPKGGAGLRVSAKWARSTAGIPEPEKGEELLGEAAAPAGDANGEEKPTDGEDNGKPSKTTDNPDDNEGPADESGDAGGGNE